MAELRWLFTMRTHEEIEAMESVVEAARGVVGEISSNPLVVWPEGIATDRFGQLMGDLAILDVLRGGED